jgi:hypothetical protein
MLFQKIQRIEGQKMPNQDQKVLRDKLLRNLVAKATVASQPNIDGTRKIRNELEQLRSITLFFDNLLVAIGQVALKISAASELLEGFKNVERDKKSKLSSKRDKYTKTRAWPDRDDSRSELSLRDDKRPRYQETVEAAFEQRSLDTSCWICGNHHQGECRRKDLAWAKE